MVRGGFTQQMRYLPVADIFINAIACLLILIIISSRDIISEHRIPYPDTTVYCVIENSKPAIYEEIPSKNSHTYRRIAVLQPFLYKLQNDKHLVHRLMIITTVQDFHACRKQLQAVVQRAKQDFDNIHARPRPKSYLITDYHLVHQLPAALRSSGP